MNYFYSIENSQIDTHFFGQTIISDDFVLIIHDFLKKIYENILILHSHNVFTINNSHLYIKKMSFHNFSYILHGKIYFDMEKCSFYTNEEKNKTTEINLPDICGIQIILSQIKKLILNKNSNLNDYKSNKNDNLNEFEHNNFCCKKYIDKNRITNTNENTKSKKITFDKYLNKKNISIEKESLHNEIHKRSKLIDPLVVIEKNKIKNREKLLEEKNNEKKRIFTSDLSVYKKIKNDLENDIINEIPPLFLDKYFIFKLLDEDNLLNSDNNYLLFMAMYESDNNSDDEKKKNIDIGTITVLHEDGGLQANLHPHEEALKESIVQARYSLSTDTNLNKIIDIEDIINMTEKKEKEKVQCTNINKINTTKKINKNEKKLLNKNEFDNNIDLTDILNDNFIKRNNINDYILNTDNNDYGIF